MTAGVVGSAPSQPWTARVARTLAVDRIGAIYVWLAIVAVFSFWAPETFPQVATAKQVVDSYAVTGLAALAITIPLCARVFDLSFAAVITLTGVATARLVVEGVGIVPAVALGLLLGLGMGLVNAIVVVVMKIDSFIGTLATGLLMAALVTMITHDTPVSDPVLFGDFSKIGQTSYEGITLPVLYMAIVAVAIWYLLEHTATGRRLYATGFNPDAARLAGVRVQRLRFMALLASGFLSGACGIVLASTLSSGSPTAGAPYLLPAFAAAFLGATPAEARALQRLGHRDRRVVARHRDHGAAARRSGAVGAGHVRRHRPHRLARGDGSPAARRGVRSRRHTRSRAQRAPGFGAGARRR